jgi:hypothetical protein
MANPQVPVTYEFTLTVNPVDIEGNPVADTLTWTNSDTTGATTLTADGTSTLEVTIAVPGPGTPTGVVITATDANGVSGSYTFDVVADVATAFTLAAGTPTKIPAAA